MDGASKPQDAVHVQWQCLLCVAARSFAILDDGPLGAAPERAHPWNSGCWPESRGQNPPVDMEPQPSP